MPRRARRNHTPAFRARVALAAIKGDRTLSQLAEQFDVHPNQVTSWKAQLEGGAANVFGPGSGDGTSPPAVDVPSEVHVKARMSASAFDPLIPGTDAEPPVET